APTGREPATSPLGPGTEEALFIELDAALQTRFEARGRPAPAGRYSLLQLLSAEGVAALDHFPVHARVLAWLADRRGVAELPPASLAALRRYDQAFLDLGFPPPFRPFL